MSVKLHQPNDPTIPFCNEACHRVERIDVERLARALRNSTFNLRPHTTDAQRMAKAIRAAYEAAPPSEKGPVGP